jgi:hypothetical protein
LEVVMSSSRKLNSGVVRLVHRALDGNRDQCATVELSRDALAQVAGELGRLGKMLDEERLDGPPVEAQAMPHARLEGRDMAAIERLDAKLESLLSPSPDLKRGRRGNKSASFVSEVAEQTSPESSRLWDTVAVAKFLRVSPSWVRHRTAAGTMPFMRVGGWMVRFDPETIRAWAEQDGPGAVRKLDR